MGPSVGAGRAALLQGGEAPLTPEVKGRKAYFIAWWLSRGLDE